jgi:phenylalanyl-tRNA synthetase alpha subunit
MKNLTEQLGHPIQMIVESITTSSFFSDFTQVQVPEIVSEWETFDLFNFPEEHVARRPSDSYFLHKSNIKKESMLLRPHTSVMWYYYLLNQNGLEELKNE